VSSQEMEFICLEYNSIRFQITGKINKQLPPDVTAFDEIPINLNIIKQKEVKILWYLKIQI